MPVGARAEVLYGRSSQRCYKREDRTAPRTERQTVQIAFPIRERPALVKGGSLEASVISGRLESIML
jgi:hypothetical protein